MKLAVTGADGFLGRHVRVALRAQGAHDVVALGRADFADSARLAGALNGTDAVLHLAGVNRDRPEVVEEQNVTLAEQLVDAMARLEHSPRAVLYANSVHAGRDDPYGRGKQRAQEILAAWADKTDGALADLHLPNLFGEWGRPFYNSVVATFCHQLTVGETPTILEDRSIELVHAQTVAARFIEELADLETSRVLAVSGRRMAVSELLARLREVAGVYRAGRIPDLADPWDVDLFNTYRSYLYPGWYPRPLRSNRDPRGNFVEVAQSLGGEAQTSFSTTVPGVTRGEHYHLRKVERFVVLAGRATIALRPVLGDQVTTYTVDGDDPVFVDMPTLCAHNITNVGDGLLYTVFWANEIFDPDRTDTYREPVG